MKFTVLFPFRSQICVFVPYNLKNFNLYRFEKILKKNPPETQNLLCFLSPTFCRDPYLHHCFPL